MILDFEGKGHKLSYVCNCHLPYPNRNNTLWDRLMVSILCNSWPWIIAGLMECS